MTNYIALSIPFFFLLIGIEVGAARLMKRSVYRFSDSIADLACGVVQQVVVVAIALLTIPVYKALYDHFALFQVPMEPVWVWLVVFLGVDFFYYWFHRVSHRVNLLWAAHVVHHQSEEYNLTVALRQSALQPGFSWFFYLPLAVIGVPPIMYLTLAALNTLYQFWIHTRLVGRMGPLEWILNTPSHHRVHHGQNAKYLDRNHGGTLIIWDRMFGTFQAEEEEVVYGVTEPLESWDPIWANLHTWVVTFRRAAQTQRLKDKLLLFVRPPGWLPEDLAHTKAARGWPPPQYDPLPSRSAVVYALLQFAVMASATVAYLTIPVSELPAKLALGASIVAAMTGLAGLLQGRRWAFGVEGLRPLSLVGAALLAVPELFERPEVVILAVAYVLASAVGLSRVRGAAAVPENAATDLHVAR